MLKNDREDQSDRQRKNEEILISVKEEMNILHTIRGRKVNGIGHVLCRSCLLKNVTEGKRRGRRQRQILDDVRETWRYWQLKEDAMDRTVLRTRFGRSYGQVIRWTAWWWRPPKLEVIIIWTYTGYFYQGRKCNGSVHSYLEGARFEVWSK